MNKPFTKLSACLLAAAVAFSASGVHTFAAEQPAVIAQVQATNYAVGLNYDGSGFTLTFADKTQAKSMYVQTASNISIKDGSTTYTLKKGLYYFNAEGKLNQNPTGIGIRKVYPVSTAFEKKTPVNYVVKNAACTNKSDVISSGSIYFTGKYGSKIYKSGRPYSGVADVSSVMYKVTNGTYNSKTKYTGLLKTSYVSVSAQKLKSATNLYYNSGKPYTGVVSRKYYKNGKAQNVSGGRKIGNSVYYFKKGVAVTGWKRLKSYGGGTAKYKYYFKKNGRLVMDLFSVNRNYYIKQKMKIRVNLTTHNTTFYIYDNQTKDYTIPALTAICSTSRTRTGTPTGHFRLEKTSARKWFIYTKSNPYHYYQYGVHIKGSKSWFHSTMHRTTSRNSLIVNGAAGYNKLGTNQTTACIRHQAGVAKLIYDISTKTYRKARVWVDVYRSGTQGPFGKITLAQTTGKLKSSQKYDPTVNYKKLCKY